MPNLIHLSDLHFGPCFVPHLGQVILKEIANLNPDAVIISGDFTYRGRFAEYAAAREFVGQIVRPLLVIPGNHDQPLYSVFERLTTPYARYCQYICDTVDASLAIDGLFALGLNDCHPILPGGFWSRQQRAWIEEQLFRAPRDAVRLVATHHQFIWGGKWRPAGFWYPTRALDWLAARGVDLVLNGHTHIPTASQLGSGLVVVRAGTATSDRVRHGCGNSYNFIAVDSNQISVFVRQYDAQADAYLAAKAYTFPRRKNPN
ncbi:MAG: metallophosphoesterase [Chloroflexi bacterium]|nr:metallophosphoesterase [Chloroflexota bacterium]